MKDRQAPRRQPLNRGVPHEQLANYAPQKGVVVTRGEPREEGEHEHVNDVPLHNFPYKYGPKTKFCAANNGTCKAYHTKDSKYCAGHKRSLNDES